MNNIVFITDGLGNQMFQYAFYLYLRKKNVPAKYECSIAANDPTHNGYELERVFGIPKKKQILHYLFSRLYSRFLLHHPRVNSLLNFSAIYDHEGGYIPFFYLRGNNYFLGWWQSYKYFEEQELREQIKKSFKFKCKPSKQTILVKEQIQNSNSISIHIRRGDYLHSRFAKRFNNICTLPYYQQAVHYFTRNDENCSFFVFSDDIEWVKNNLSIPNAQYIDFNKREDSWQDMYLMSQCKNNIVANSTFSFWGAWLNDNPNKIVICPLRFDNEGHAPDLYPKEWIRIKG